jgi:hypothetical protein
VGVICVNRGRCDQVNMRATLFREKYKACFIGLTSCSPLPIFSLA